MMMGLNDVWLVVVVTCVLSVGSDEENLQTVGCLYNFGG